MISTKIVSPQLSDVCERPRVYALLDADGGHCLSWLSAPAGSGKTCILGSYLRAKRQRTVWLHLDESDSSLAGFFFFLKAAVRALVGKRANTLPAFRPEYQQGAAAFSRSYFDKLFALLPAGTALVLDNYEVVTDESEVHEVLAGAINRTPTTLHWYIASRSRPPTAFARLRLDRLKELTWAQLRFTFDETVELARSRGQSSLPAPELERLQELTQGWAAGIVLLLANGSVRADALDPVLFEDSKPMFDYFAAEVFNRLPPLHQQVLLKTALLPQVDGQAATRLTGIPSAPWILEDMAERNYFSFRYQNGGSLFRFHPLFRSFLLERAREVLTPKQRQELSKHAAELLERDGQLESAAELFKQAGEWQELAELVFRNAETVIAQGRHQLLTQWITAIPPGAVQASRGWLLYWLGTARLPFDPELARVDHERAFELFLEVSQPTNKQLEGLFLSWAGVIEATLFSWSLITHLDYWIDILDELLLRYKPPSLKVEARVTALMHGALIFRRPESDAVHVWEKRLRRFLLLVRFLDVNHYVLLANNLFQHDLWTGRLTRGMDLLASLERVASSKNVTPMAKGCWYMMRAVSSLFTGTYADGLCAVEQGVKHCRDTGVLFWEPILLVHGAFASLAIGNLEEAEEYLAEMRGTLRTSQSNSSLLYHDASAQLALARGESGKADEHARLAVDQAVTNGAMFPEAGVRLGRAHTLCAASQPARARQEFQACLALARAMKSACIEARALVGLAYLEFGQGDTLSGNRALAQGLALSRRQGYQTHVWWMPEVFALMCERAIVAGIEVDYVRGLIHSRNILPNSERALERGWPVVLRVECLGATRLSLHDKPLSFSRKAQLRPLELLLAIIAFGGERVSEARLAMALWPDSEGDAAFQALATTLHRLRKLLGHDVVVRREQCLTLNKDLCWVDALACNRSWSRLEKLDLQALLWSIERYGGQFLPEVTAPWAVVFRERLSAKFVRAACEGTRRLEQANEWRRAVELIERCLDAEPTAEVLYRELIRLLRERNRHAEARAVYERCRRTLRATFDVDPSPETMSLRGQI